MPPKRDWLDMTWREFAAGDPARWIAVLPLAAVEQHGPHLPLGTDLHIAEAYLARVRTLLPTQLPAVFLPPLAIGSSPEHAGFPGTLSLSGATLTAVLREVGEGVRRAGVRKLVLVNSHGGNWPAIEMAALELRSDCRMLTVTTSWSRLGYPEGLFAADELAHGIHAGAVETAIMRAARPPSVRLSEAEDFASAGRAMANEFDLLRLARPAGIGWMAQDLNPSGAVGNAAAATAADGEAALAHGARAFVALLAEVERFDLAQLADGPLGQS